jgi:ATP-dependent DNA helicase RecG
MKHHSSIPHNPLIAGAFFRSGQIELWGRGIDKILTSCKAWGKPDPTFAFNQGCEFSVTFYANTVNNISDSNQIVEIQQYFDINTAKYSLNNTQIKLIKIILANKNITAKKYQLN